MIRKLMVNEHHRISFDRSTAGWATQQLTVVCSNSGLLGIYLYIYIYIDMRPKTITMIS